MLYFIFTPILDKMSDTSVQNSPMPKRKRRDSTTEQQQQQQEQQADSDELQSKQQESIVIKTEYQQNSLEILDIHNPMFVSQSSPPTPPPTTTSNKLKIDDLTEKELVQIFQWLDFPDLLNVANATKKLRNAAGKIYTRKYAHKLVKFDVETIGSNIDETLTTFEINDARTCLLMFRAFGAFIAKLHLNFNGIGQRRIRAMSQALNDYCAKTLNELEWHHVPANAITQKFPKLTILRVKNGHLGGQTAQFQETFPMLCALELSNIQAENRKCIERTFLKLMHLKVHIEMHKGMDFLKSNVKAAIQMNPQLRSFCIGSGCDSKLLPYINDMLPLLTHLEIQQPRSKLFDSEIDAVHFERVRNFTLDITQSKDSFSNIPLRFDRLKKFHLNAGKQHRDKWIDFVVKHRRLVELHLLNFDWFHVVSKAQLDKLAGLPKLTRLILDWHISDSAQLVQFINNCPSLQEIRLTTGTQNERASICSKLTAGWYMQIDRNFLTLQRTVNDDDGDDDDGVDNNLK